MRALGGLETDPAGIALDLARTPHGVLHNQYVCPLCDEKVDHALDDSDVSWHSEACPYRRARRFQELMED